MVLEKQLGRDQLILVDAMGYSGAIAESSKLKKTKVRRNLVGARSLEGLGTLGRLGLEGLLLFMYPNFIL